MKQTFRLVRAPVVERDGFESFTHGRMYFEGVAFCHTCEDEDRRLEDGPTHVGSTKVYGKTAIPRGKYRLITSESPRFGRILPEVLKVPGFTGIRIHGGNTAEDSHGCILVGQEKRATGVGKSAAVVQRIIDTIDDAAELGIETWLEVA
jgi:hypothetical protein